MRKLIVEAELSAKIDEVEVILGELASNAVRYGEDPMSIAVLAHDGLLAICTFDCGQGYDLEQKLAINSTGENGRGLRIVRALSNGVSVHHEPGGGFCVCVSIAID